jgi:hypothetical protein
VGDPSVLRDLEALKALHLSKGHDYADASDPLKNYVQSGKDAGIEPWRVAFARFSEKYHRVVNLLAKGDAPNHESLDDTFMDLAAMALIVKSLRSRSGQTGHATGHNAIGVPVRDSRISDMPNPGLAIPNMGLYRCSKL